MSDFDSLEEPTYLRLKAGRYQIQHSTYTPMVNSFPITVAQEAADTNVKTNVNTEPQPALTKLLLDHNCPGPLGLYQKEPKTYRDYAGDMLVLVVFAVLLIPIVVTGLFRVIAAKNKRDFIKGIIKTQAPYPRQSRSIHYEPSETRKLEEEYNQKRGLQCPQPATQEELERHAELVALHPERYEPPPTIPNFGPRSSRRHRR